MKRRDFLLDITRLAAMTAVVPNDWRVIHRPSFVDNPFALGVASGDPLPNAVMIWTRLAPRPVEAEGGMAGLRTAVSWEVADDEGFGKIVKRGRATAAPELGYSVHVDVQGLAPDRWYFYRFTANDAASPVGRMRTAPDATDTRSLRFAFASCQHYEQGLYTAYEHMAREELDLVSHLGDYIYEGGPTPGRVRLHTAEARTLDQYRARYGQYKMDPALQAAHHRCPWIVTWDDHEVDNNYAGTTGENDMESDEQMRLRRAAGYQAWWEHQPVRVPRATSWADLTIMRGFRWGTLANFWVLDGRQYRSPEACGGVQQKVPCGDWADERRTLLGAPQERWLDENLASSRARWEVIANQTMVAHFDGTPGPDDSASMDNWSGYPAARTRLLRSIERHAKNRTVVITGDIHSNWVNELRPDARTTSVAAEFVGTSISSGGDGSDQSPYVQNNLGENPQVKWQNNRRGYVFCEATPDKWRTDYRTVEYVTRPGAPIQTPSTWTIQRGRPEIHRDA